MEEKTSFRQRCIALSVGESITVPADEVGYTTVRTYASELGFAYMRVYTTKRNRAERTFTITREQ